MEIFWIIAIYLIGVILSVKEVRKHRVYGALRNFHMWKSVLSWVYFFWIKIDDANYSS